MEQRMLNCCVFVANVQVQMLVACICRSACADALCQCLPPYLESLPLCDGPRGDTGDTAVDNLLHLGWFGASCNSAGKFFLVQSLMFSVQLFLSAWTASSLQNTLQGVMAGDVAKPQYFFPLYCCWKGPQMLRKHSNLESDGIVGSLFSPWCVEKSLKSNHSERPESSSLSLCCQNPAITSIYISWLRELVLFKA